MPDITRFVAGSLLWLNISSHCFHIVTNGFMLIAIKHEKSSTGKLNFAAILRHTRQTEKNLSIKRCENGMRTMIYNVQMKNINVVEYLIQKHISNELITCSRSDFRSTPAHSPDENTLSFFSVLCMWLSNFLKNISFYNNFVAFWYWMSLFPFSCLFLSKSIYLLPFQSISTQME